MKHKDEKRDDCVIKYSDKPLIGRPKCYENKIENKKINYKKYKKFEITDEFIADLILKFKIYLRDFSNEKDQKV